MEVVLMQCGHESWCKTLALLGCKWLYTIHSNKEQGLGRAAITALLSTRRETLPVQDQIQPHAKTKLVFQWTNLELYMNYTTTQSKITVRISGSREKPYDCLMQKRS